MRAWVADSLTGIAGLSQREVAEPRRGPGEVLVQVIACGLIHPDLLLVKGHYQQQPVGEFIVGSEIAGTVLEAPRESGLRPGRRVLVCGWLGGAAERVTVSADRAVPLPENVAADMAAAIGFNYPTALHFVERAAIKPADTVVVTGVGGGLGSAVLSVLRVLGCRTIAYVNRDAALPYVIALDPDEVLRPDRCGSVGAIADVVIDCVGGLLPASLDLLRVNGRYVVAGFAGSRSVDRIRTNRLIFENLSLIGAAWDGHTNSGQATRQNHYPRLFDMLDEGLRVATFRSYPVWDEGPVRALMDMDSRRLIGKAVLTGFAE